MNRSAALLLSMMLAAPASASESIALWGTPKYRAGFSHFDYVNPDAPKGGSIKLSTNAAFDSMNPFILKGVSAPGVAGYVYQTLMTGSYDEPQSYYPLIASYITLAPDRSYADFTLNPNAKWSDGKPVTVEDVLWSFAILKEKGHPSLKVQYKPMTLKATGPHSIRFTFADKSHRELPLIAASMPVLPKHYFCEGVADTATAQGVSLSPRERLGEGETRAKVSGQQLAAEQAAPSPHPSPSGRGGSPVSTLSQTTHDSPCVPFDKTTMNPPIGSGPYKVSAVEPGRSITFTRDKNYWGANLPTQRGFNNFDTVRYDVYRDDTVALEGIKSHQFDFYEEFIARNWATAYDVPAVRSGQIKKELIPNKIPRGMQGFIFNTREAKFADRRVRQAIGLTLDFEWMNQTLFYGAYERNKSFFGNTEFEAKGLPGADELKLLQPFKAALPPSLFTTPYEVPTTDGSGISRSNLIKAQSLLNDAGWVMKDGGRVNAKTGEKLTIEFLMTQRTFERVISIMRHNLKKLGIDSSFRYVDASQYQKRLEKKQFDIVSIWWNLGLFYPSTEQYLYWHSSQADTDGSQNLAGTKSPAIDAVVTDIQNAQKLEDLRAAARALDRVLTNEYYVIPHWTITAWRIAYWNQFGKPAVTPAYSLGLDTWWDKKLGTNSASGAPSPGGRGKSEARGEGRPRAEALESKSTEEQARPHPDPLPPGEGAHTSRPTPDTTVNGRSMK